jgi:hypothetical protein
MRYVAVFAVAVSLGFAGFASGASFDGTKALVCKFESLAECDTDALCQSVESGEIDLPESIRVDFKGKRLRSEDGQRTSPIHSTDITNAVLIAQGSQNGRGWSMTIDRETGKMTGTIAESAGAMVLFGSCADAP